MTTFCNTRAYSRRQFLSLLATGALMPLLPSCLAKNLAINIGFHDWPGYEPTLLAHSLGWSDDKLINLIQTQSISDSIRQLEQGKLDGVGLTLADVLRAREMGIPLSVILVCDISTGAGQFLVRPEIKELAAIKGCRIAVEEGVLGALMLHQVLQMANLSLADVMPVELSVDQQLDAWQRGAIDAVLTYESASLAIMKLGGVRLCKRSVPPDLMVNVFAVRAELLDFAHSAALHHMVNVHLQAIEYLNTNADDAMYRMAAHFQLPAEQVMVTFKSLVLSDLEHNIRMLGTTEPYLLKSATAIADIMLEAGILHKPVELAGLLKVDYLPVSR
ncbi:MAG: ABC transporter substrate-binding protein [Methylovulum sp.]|jgi:NitT/TauT family transport system substrate-binding protein|nr:ABC transporter substrate-binding protein [Methylovulum sp.]MCF7999128.1 ABC transporter substrate-binding protein [Methylovulum sp.]